MRKFIFLKDENYSSNLYNNLIGYMEDCKLLSMPAAETNPYKVKLVTSEDAVNMTKEHPMLMQCKRVGTPDKISLVSFGGCVYHLDIEKMVELADEHHVASLVSFPVESFSEAEQLSKAKLYGGQVKENEDFCFVYMSLVKIGKTNIYYLIVNHTLVHTISEIDIEEETEIVQVKDVTNSLRDSVFSIHVDNLFGNTVYCEDGNEARFRFFTSGVVEGIKETFSKLRFDIEAINCEYIREKDGYTVQKKEGKTGFIRFKLSNRFLDDRVNKNEKLEWEYVLVE